MPKQISDKRRLIATPRAPKAIGPSSPAVRVGDLIFTSGQLPVDPDTGGVVEGDIRAQTRCVLENLKTIVEAAGSDLAHMVKFTCFLADTGDFPAVNEVFQEFIAGDFPARSCVAVRTLPKNVSVEIEAVAVVP